MKLSGNTIFITGGGSGIGRGLAEALHRLGNKVIISGRRRGHLDAVVAANPGMEAVELDITDPASINHVAAKLIADHPDLNVLINNAGIMQADAAGGRIDDELMVATITTNLMGPIRMTVGADRAPEGQERRRRRLYEFRTGLRADGGRPPSIRRPRRRCIPTPCRNASCCRTPTVRVLEIAPPWVRTELMNSQEAEQAMPLDQFIEETIAVLAHRCRRDPGGCRQAVPGQRRPERTWPRQRLQRTDDGDLRRGLALLPGCHVLLEDEGPGPRSIEEPRLVQPDLA